MATPKPGEIRCPTCHRSTPPAAFCTQCGSAIPSDARIRPRGLDRDELQERIRARRTGGDPYRRGVGGDWPTYERFEPEPEDRVAVRRGEELGPRPDLLAEDPDAPPPMPAALPRPPGAPHPVEPRPDLTRDRDEWSPRPLPVETPVPAGMDRDDTRVEQPVGERFGGRSPDRALEDVPPPAAPYLAPVDDYGREERDVEYVDYTDFSEEEQPYPAEYEEWEEDRDRRSAGAGALAILGFLALGVVALLGGAVLAGIFSGDPQTGGVGDASPTPVISSAPDETAAPVDTVEPTPSQDAGGSEAPRQSGDPIVFPDGFTAEVQPCLPGSADVDGCNSNASTNGGTLDIWVGFRQGTENDVISARVVGPDGRTTDAGTMDLTRIGCVPDCPGGWTYFPISGLPAGTYQVEVTRNGEPAGETSFVVS